MEIWYNFLIWKHSKWIGVKLLISSPLWVVLGLSLLELWLTPNLFCLWLEVISHRNPHLVSIFNFFFLDDLDIVGLIMIIVGAIWWCCGIPPFLYELLRFVSWFGWNQKLIFQIFRIFVIHRNLIFYSNKPKSILDCVAT